nr:MAG: RNA-dependent RNA polymerase [Riboviria sp.]
MRTSAFMGLTNTVTSALTDLVKCFLNALVAGLTSLGALTLANWLDSFVSTDARISLQEKLARLEALDRDASRFLAQRPTLDGGPGTSSYVTLGRELLIRADGLCQELLGVENTAYHLALVHRIRSRVHEALQSTLFIRDHAVGRVEPYCFTFVGAPRIGKSFTMKALMSALQTTVASLNNSQGHMGQFSAAAAEGRWLYSRNLSDEFWSGHNREPVILYDDAFTGNIAPQHSEAAKRHDKELLELQSLIGCHPYSPPLPEVGAGVPCPKGTKVSPYVVALTSNYLFPEVNGREPSIIDDRIHTTFVLVRTGAPFSQDLSHLAIYRLRISLSHLRIEQDKVGWQAPYSPNSQVPTTQEEFLAWPLAPYFEEIPIEEVLTTILSGVRKKVDNWVASGALTDHIRSLFGRPPRDHPFLPPLIDFLKQRGFTVPDSFSDDVLSLGVQESIIRLRNPSRTQKLVPKSAGRISFSLAHGEFLPERLPPENRCTCPHRHLSELECVNLVHSVYSYSFDVEDVSQDRSAVVFDGETFIGTLPGTNSVSTNLTILASSYAVYHGASPFNTVLDVLSAATWDEPQTGLGFARSKNRKVVSVVFKTKMGELVTLAGVPPAPDRKYRWISYAQECALARQGLMLAWGMCSHGHELVFFEKCLAISYLTNDMYTRENHDFLQMCATISNRVRDIYPRDIEIDPELYDWTKRDCPLFPILDLKRICMYSDNAISRREAVMALIVTNLPSYNPRTIPFIDFAFNVGGSRSINFVYPRTASDTLDLDIYYGGNLLASARGIVITETFDAFLRQNWQQHPVDPLAIEYLHHYWRMMAYLAPKKQTPLQRLQIVLSRLFNFLQDHWMALLIVGATSYFTADVLHRFFSSSPASECTYSSSYHYPTNPEFAAAQPRASQAIASRVRHQGRSQGCPACFSKRKFHYSVLDQTKYEQMVRNVYENARDEVEKDYARKYLKGLYTSNSNLLHTKNMPLPQAIKHLERLQRNEPHSMTPSGSYIHLTAANAFHCRTTRAKFYDCLQAQQGLIRQFLGSHFDVIDPAYDWPDFAPSTLTVRKTNPTTPCFLDRVDSRHFECSCDKLCSVKPELLPPLMPPEAEQYLKEKSRFLASLVTFEAQGMISRATLIGEGAYLVAKHACRDLLLAEDKTSIFITGPQGKVVHFVTKDNFVLFGSNDLALLILDDSELPAFKLSKAIMRDAPSPGVTLTVRWRDSDGQLHAEPLILGGQTSSVSPTFSAKYSVYWCHPTDKLREGHSGALVCCGPQIFGHFFGLQTDTQRVLIQPWIGFPIAQAVAQHRTVERHDDLAGPLPDNECGHRILGAADTRAADNNAPTQIFPSSISASLTSLGYPSTKKPAILSKQALDIAFSKFAPQNENFDPDYVEAAKDLAVYLSNHFDVEYGCPARTIPTWDEVAQGRIGQELISKTIVMDTSPGYPYSENNLRKSDLFDGAPPLIRPKSQLVNILDSRDSALRAGDATPYLCTSNLKDELRDNARVAAKKTRLFCATPVHMNMLYRKYVLDWVARYKKARPEVTFSAIGTDVYGEDWTTLREWLSSPIAMSRDGSRTPLPNHFLMGDFSRFDTSHSRRKILLAMSVIAAGCEEPDVVMTLGHALANYFVRYNGRMFRVSNGLPSGCQLTTTINCILNTLLWLTVWRKCTGGDIHSFRQNCRLVVYGDDVVFGMCKDNFLRSLVTPQRIVNIMQNLGYTLESADSLPLRFVPLSDVQFLKRKFVVDTFDSRITHAPRPLEDIWTQLHWNRRNLNVEEQKTVFLSAAMEFGQWGPEVFNHAYDVLKQVVKTQRDKQALSLSNFRAVARKAWMRIPFSDLDPSERAKFFWRLW